MMVVIVCIGSLVRIGGQTASAISLHRLRAGYPTVQILSAPLNFLIEPQKLFLENLLRSFDILAIAIFGHLPIEFGPNLLGLHQHIMVVLRSKLKSITPNTYKLKLLPVISVHQIPATTHRG
jgi:hypothetical protein